MKTKLILTTTAALALAAVITGCGKSDSGAPGGSNSSGGKKTTVANIGSDTMVNLAAAWAEGESMSLEEAAALAIRLLDEGRWKVER